jgi:predicted SprT family Zn-dependent metalloprotease
MEIIGCWYFIFLYNCENVYIHKMKKKIKYKTKEMENVMYCKNCGMKLENGTKFCGGCGMPGNTSK